MAGVLTGNYIGLVGTPRWPCTFRVATWTVDNGHGIDLSTISILILLLLALLLLLILCQTSQDD